MITHAFCGRSKRLIAISLAVGAAGLAIGLVMAFVLVPALDDEPQATGLATLEQQPQPTASVSGGSGGGGEPPARLVAVNNSLPVPPGARTLDRPVSTGTELRTGGWVDDTPQQVIAFYERELGKVGWQQPAPAVTSYEDPRKGSSVHFSAVFIRDDLQLDIGVGENLKDPKLGKTVYGIEITTR